MALPPLKVIWGASRQTGESWHLGLFGRFDQRGRRTQGIVLSARGLLLWGAAMAVAGVFRWRGRGCGYVGPPPAQRQHLWRVGPRSGPSLRLEADAGSARAGADRAGDRRRAGPENLRRLAGAVHRAGPRSRFDQGPAGPRQALFIRGQGSPQSRGALAGRHDARVSGTGIHQGVVPPSRPTGKRLWPRWLAACDAALAQLAGQPQLADDRRVVVREKLAALLAAGRNDEVVRLAEAEDGRNDPTVREARATALLQAGRTAAAMEFISAWSAQVDRSDEQQRGLQVPENADPGLSPGGPGMTR